MIGSNTVCLYCLYCINLKFLNVIILITAKSVYYCCIDSLFFNMYYALLLLLMSVLRVDNKQTTEFLFEYCDTDHDLQFLLKTLSMFLLCRLLFLFIYCKSVAEVE